MRIALFTDSYLPNTDGVVTSILSFRKGLRAKRHDFEIFAPDSPKAKEEAGVRRFPSVAFPPYPEYRAALFPSIQKSVAQETKVRIVHCKAMTTMAISAYQFARRAGLPSVATLETMIPDGVHYILPGPLHGLGKRAAWMYLEWLYSHFDLITAPSLHTQKRMGERGIDSVVLPSPVDTERFRINANGGNAIRRELGLRGKKVVASVGRVVKEKNYSFLIKVAKEMEDGAVFLIVGKGPYLETLKKEAQAQGVAGRFRFAGFVPDSKLPDYYNAADAFVFPSPFETQGLTLLEAMACGKAGCVLQGTPMEEIIAEGENGFSFPQDASKCAEKIARCISEKSAMGEKARKTALSYSIPACTDRLLSLYNRLLL